MFNLEEFDVTKFIMDTLKEMKGNRPNFQIKKYALDWYGRGEITKENLAELEEYLAPVEVELPEDEVPETEVPAEE